MPDHTDSNPGRKAGASAISAGILACAWGAALFTSILVAGLKLWPALQGRIILALIAVGFVLFTIARASAPGTPKPLGFCARLLSPRMRAIYWAGYALMFSGVVLTAVVSLKLW